MAAGLIALGIERGDRVGIWSLNNLEWVLTMMAAARIGAILVNLNPAYQRDEIEYAMKKVMHVYRVAPKKRKFSGLCSDQQLYFFSLLDRASFPHYITPRSSNLVENFLFYE